MFRSIFRPSGGTSIIAEPANTHNGSADYLAALIKESKTAGADAVKLQIFEPDHLAVPDFQWYSVYQDIAIQMDRWAGLIAEAKASGLHVVAEVFDESAARFCLDQGVTAFKLNIADVANAGLTECIASESTAVFLSVGGSLLPEIDHVLSRLRRGRSDVVLSYGIQNYPTQLSHSHLAKIRLLTLHYGLPVCIADHLAGDHPLALVLPCLAVAAGATAVEKHIIRERKDDRYDYYSSIEPKQFLTMAALIRNVEECLGPATLNLDEVEMQYREMHKKGIVLRRDLSAGHVLTTGDVQFKRSNGPKDFLSPDEIIGKVLTIPLGANTPLLKEYLQ